MSKLGIGLYSLAGVYGQKDFAEIKRMLLKALELGVDFYDVADQYGSAEEVLGETLKNYRSKIRISTKVGITDEGGRDCSAKHINAACRKSLQRLQTDYIDYYQIHFDDPETPVEETIEALECLKKEGWIREYNVGHLPVAKVKEYVAKGNPTALMMELSPVAWQQYHDLVPFCAEHGLKILAMGTSGRGILSGKIKENEIFEAGDIRRIDPLFQKSMLQSALRVLAKLEKVGEYYQKTPIQVALNWVASLPQVEIVLSGPSTVTHLEENLGAFDWKMDREHRLELDKIIQMEEEERRNGQLSDIQEILHNDLVQDREQVVADLVYVISSIIDLGISLEANVLPLFQQLMIWKKQKGDWGIVEEIKRQLNRYI